MKRFRFALEPLRRLRELERRRCEREVMLAHAATRRAEDRLRALAAAEERGRRGLHGLLRQGADGAEIESAWHAIVAAGAACAGAAQELERQRALAEDARRALLLAERDRELVDTLKTAQLADWRRGRSRWDQALLDDLDRSRRRGPATPPLGAPTRRSG